MCYGIKNFNWVAILFTLTLFIVTFRLRSMWRPMSVWACPCDTQCQPEPVRVTPNVSQSLPCGTQCQSEPAVWHPMSVWACRVAPNVSLSLPCGTQCQSERACPPWRVEDWPLIYLSQFNNPTRRIVWNFYIIIFNFPGWHETFRANFLLQAKDWPICRKNNNAQYPQIPSGWPMVSFPLSW
jgi:hypothetical protein